MKKVSLLIINHASLIKIKRTFYVCLTIILLLSSARLFAQVGNTAWSDIKKLGVIPQNNPDFTIEAFKQLSCSNGEDQWGEIVITNNSSKRYRIEATVVITTTCGNEATGHFFDFLDPHTHSGPMYPWAVSVPAKQCNGTKFKDSDGLTQYDRIKSVGFKNFTYIQTELSTGNIGPISNDQSQTTRDSSTSNTYTPSRSTTSSTSTPPGTLQDFDSKVSNVTGQLQKLLQEKYERGQQQSDARYAAKKKEREEKYEADIKVQADKQAKLDEEDKRKWDEHDSERKNAREIGMGVGLFQKPSEADIENPNLKSLYYIAYFRKDNNVWIMKPIKIDKYSDDSWISPESLKKKIKVLFPDTYNVVADEDELHIVGYIITERSAIASYNALLQNCKAAGCTINTIKPITN